MKLPNIENKPYKLGIYEKAINAKFDWKDRFAIAKKAKFDFVEISIDEANERIERLYWSDKQIDNLRSTMLASGLYINSMCLSANRRFPLGSKERKIRDKGLEIIHLALIFAKKLGIRIIQLAGYDEYYQPSDEVTKKYFLENMKKVCRWAQYYSIQIAFESMDTPFLGTLSRIWNVLTYLNSPMLAIYPDIGNLNQFARGNFENELELAKNKILAFHFKDTTPTQFKTVPFGKGTVDFVESFKSIFKIDFHGPFMIEMWSKNDPKQSAESATSEISAAHKFFAEKYNIARKEFLAKKA
ncbi:L-ribulose-5-phosphate 3-epimerase [[Mycoplasma] testudinis]|uniref:L-ribulose-5-phosphate 3-epimerase n=1 Tax=[Mycoplasma] testudinis TaxID=33924 RepID=UPI000485A6F6|nr:L-ribulose-5-phosphate 3-epimerase [[Mycoplasma] testudinis]